MREFMGFMADSKIAAPKGQLFLTLLPFPPGRGQNNAWEEVYLDTRKNPGRDTLQQSAKSKCTLPEGKGSDRVIVFSVDLHMYASGINLVSYHPAGYYALKDNSISLSCMPIAYNMDTGSIMFNTAFKYMGGPKYGAGRSRGVDGRTAFFGVNAIQCASGTIRLDISVERLVSGLTGKDSTMSVAEFFKSGSKVADTVTKHYGSLFTNCREKPVCLYAQWSTHCRLAYRICLQKTFLSPYYTGGEVGGPPDVDVMDALQAVHDSMDKTVSEMRSQMTLRSEEEAMTNFRATMKNAEKFKRYIRADSESLSMLLAKVTLTTCYGIPRKARQGKCLPLGDESTPTAIGMEFSRAFEEIGRKTKESIDKDVAVENEFFKQAEGKIPRRSGNDPVYEKTPIDIFEALPEELEVVPNDLFEVRSPRVSVPEPARPRIAAGIVYPAISRVSSVMPTMKGILLSACDYKGCECTV
eukprot:s7779_g4.t2